MPSGRISMKIIVILLCTLLISCQDTTSTENAMPLDKNTPITLKLNEHPKEFVGRLGALEYSVDEQPAGLNFYELDWRNDAPGNITIDHNQYSFSIPYVLSVVGTENADFPEKGIARYFISSGITATDTMSHDEARLTLSAFLQELVDKGWRNSLFYSVPRLKGKQSYDYAINQFVYPPDPNYTPNLEQWMALGSDAMWLLYANNLIMEVTFRRDSKKMDPDKPGAYLLSFSIYGVEKYAKDHFESTERDRWQALWVDEIKRLKSERYATEKQLIEQGYTINTDYQDPIIHPDDPVEPDVVVPTKTK